MAVNTVLFKLKAFNSHYLYRLPRPIQRKCFEDSLAQFSYQTLAAAKVKQQLIQQI